MKKLALPFIPLMLLYGCKDDIPTVSLGLDDVYYIARMQKLALDPALSGSNYIWTINGQIVSRQHDYLFIAAEEGEYKLSFEIVDNSTPYKFDFIVNVFHEEIEYSPYISKVLEYCPAPGQFINNIPMYDKGDTYNDILQKVQESISGTNDVPISLGGFGGYVTFAFDHTVMNVDGEKDFRIWGNAFYELTNPGSRGGSSEPGIVMVSLDVNCNGEPDDPWYELAGSEYYKPETCHEYSITYTRAGNEDDIPWVDSEGNTGVIEHNMFHAQPYFPQWLENGELTFSGSRLADNTVDKSGNGTYYALYAYPWGYADNHPNDNEELNSFDIGWAVDTNGQKVYLPGVDFIKVYTGVNQSSGWLGESSTEISRAADLHLTVSDR